MIETIKNGIVGKNTPIRDAAAKATGQIKYVADMSFPNMLYAKVLFSPVAHAKIKHIDTSKAEALEGVAAVICYKNTPQIRFNSCGEEIDGTLSERVFDDTVRYIGDRVAAVAAEDIKIAEQALRLIEVEYEELPICLDPEEAIKEGAYPIHECGNCFTDVNLKCGDVEEGFAQSDLIFENDYYVPAIHHSAIETHASISTYDYNGKLTIYTSSQDTFGQRANLSLILDLPMSKIRLVAPVIGGGFGGKIDLITHPVSAILAMKTCRPVKLVYNRKEDIVSTRTRHAVKIHLKTGMKKDGTLVAQDVTAYLNAGAQATATNSVVWALGGKVFRIYKTPNLRYHGMGIYTNSPIAGAMRGFGSPQLSYAFSTQLNEIANELGIDVTELQMKNLVTPDCINPLTNIPYGNPRPVDCVKKGKELIHWDESVLEQKASIGQRYRIGVGMAVGDHGSGLCFAKLDNSAIILKMNDDGSLVLYTGTHDMGNGSVTTQAMIVSELIGLDLEKIACVQADTDASPYNYGDYASRGTYIAGHAATNAAIQLKDELLKEASQLLEEDIEFLDIHDNVVSSTRDSNKHASVGEVVIHARNVNRRELIVSQTYSSINDPVSYGAHFAKVKVDTETGEVTVLDYSGVHDVGKCINPLNLEGQVQGGAQMGIGYALYEGIQLNEQGKVLNQTFRSYHIPTSKDMPFIKTGFIEEIEPTGPFGAKSIGECATVPSAPAVSNAVVNALGIEFRKLPLKPEVILEALKK